MEAPAVIESNRPPPEWPTNGEVCLDHLEVGVGIFTCSKLTHPKYPVNAFRESHMKEELCRRKPHYIS